MLKNKDKVKGHTGGRHVADSLAIVVPSSL